MKNKETAAKLTLLGIAVIWGTSFVVLKNVLDSISTLWLLAIRFLTSAVFMLLFTWKKIGGINRQCLRGGIIMGIALLVAYVFQTYGLVYTTPGKNAFLTATYCVLTPFLAWLVYRRNPGLSSYVAAVLCITGVGFVSLSEGFTAINLGDMLTLVCGIFFAVQIIVMEEYRESGDAAVLSMIEFTTAGVVFLILALLFEPIPKAVPASSVFGILYLSVMCTAICFFLQAWGMQYTSSSAAAMLMTLESVFGALASVLFYHEKITLKMFIGFALIFAAVVISELKPFGTEKTVE